MELFIDNVVTTLTVEQILALQNVNGSSDMGTVVGGKFVGGTLDGASYTSSVNGGRVEIFPNDEPTTGFVSYASDDSVVFKTVVGGDNAGDVIIGDYAGGQGIFWDQSAGTIDVQGGITVDSLDIPDQVTADSFHVDSSGNTWWGATTLGSSVANVLKDGSATFTNVVAGDGTIRFLQYDGTSLTILGQRLFNEFVGSWTDGLTETTTNATITRVILDTRLRRSTGGNYSLSSGIIGYEYGAGVEFDWDYDYDLTFRLAAETGTVDSGGLAGSAFLWGIQDRQVTVLSPSLGTNLSVTARHTAFINDKDGNLYASCADGTTQTTSQITGITTTAEHEYRVIFDTGSNAKFYIDDVLKATLTTNLPSGAGTNNEPSLFWGEVCERNVGGGEALLYNNYKLIIT